MLNWADHRNRIGLRTISNHNQRLVSISFWFFFKTSRLITSLKAFGYPSTYRPQHLPIIFDQVLKTAKPEFKINIITFKEG